MNESPVFSRMTKTVSEYTMASNLLPKFYIYLNFTTEHKTPHIYVSCKH